MIILKVAKAEGFALSLEETFFKMTPLAPPSSRFRANLLVFRLGSGICPSCFFEPRVKDNS